MYRTIIIMALAIMFSVESFAENYCPLGDVVISSHNKNKAYDCLTYNSEKDKWEGHNGKETDFYDPDTSLIFNEDGRYYRRWTTDKNGKKIGRVVLEENPPYWIISRYDFAVVLNANRIVFDSKKMVWVAFIESNGETLVKTFSVKNFEAFDENGSMDREVIEYLANKI